MPRAIAAPAATDVAELASRIRSVAQRRLTPDVTYDPDRHALLLASEVAAGEPRLAMAAHRLLVATARNHLAHWGGIEPAVSELLCCLTEFLELHGFEYQNKKWTAQQPRPLKERAHA